MTLLAFFSVKPLPFLEAELGNLDDSCQVGETEYLKEYEHLEPNGKVSDLVNFFGQIIYLRLRVDVETYEENPCGIMSGTDEMTVLWGDNGTSSFFELNTRILSVTKGDRQTGFEDYEEQISLLLPRIGSSFIEVNRCEGHCYIVEGPVRVQRSFTSEGWVGVALRPINMYENSYLTSGYECRLKVLDKKFSWIAPIYCAIF